MQSDHWKSEGYLSDQNGLELFEEIGRRIVHYEDEFGEISSIAISLPGAVTSPDLIHRSSRLNIQSQCVRKDVFKTGKWEKIHFLHDMECIAHGETDIVNQRASELNLGKPSCVCHVFVDKGVGSALMINGEVHKGAGVAGPLGRLIVEPQGTFHEQFSSKGTLETYCGKPFLSRNFVDLYLTEKGKSGSEEGSTRFRNALNAAANNNAKEHVAWDAISEGINRSDPIALAVVDEATKYLGLAISHLAVIANPEFVCLSGSVIDNVPTFYENTETYARRSTWGLSWEKTNFVQSQRGRDSQVDGALNYLMKRG